MPYFTKFRERTTKQRCKKPYVNFSVSLLFFPSALKGCYKKNGVVFLVQIQDPHNIYLKDEYIRSAEYMLFSVHVKTRSSLWWWINTLICIFRYIYHYFFFFVINNEHIEKPLTSCCLFVIISSNTYTVLVWFDEFSGP